MAQILLTGAKGQVGLELVEELLKRGHRVIACSHQDLDIADETSVQSMFASTKIDLVINSAAYTAVDKAEEEKDLAYAVNALGPKYLANACQAYNVPLIHISTDYVYDNNLSKLHTEDEVTNTACVYGNTKLFGEKYISQSGCDAVVLRASWIFGRYGKNFVKAMLNLSKTRDTLTVVCDEVGNPTPARALAYDICNIADMIFKGGFDKYGVYNYCGRDAIARNDFAKVILAKAGSLGLIKHRVTVTPITTKEFGAKAKRPNDSRMSTALFEKTFNLKTPMWHEYLEETLLG